MFVKLLPSVSAARKPNTWGSNMEAITSLFIDLIKTFFYIGIGFGSVLFLGLTILGISVKEN